jgi:hypothetical protein
MYKPGLDLTGGVWIGGRFSSSAVIRQRSIFHRNRLCVKEGLRRRFAKTPASMVRLAAMLAPKSSVRSFEK